MRAVGIVLTLRIYNSRGNQCLAGGAGGRESPEQMATNRADVVSETRQLSREARIASNFFDKIAEILD